MLAVKNYKVNGSEYMAIDGREFSPDGAEIAAIADRRSGVGADFVMVLTGVKTAPFRLYDKDGFSVPAGRDAYRVLARCQADGKTAVDAAYMVRHLHGDALAAAGDAGISCFEIHITDSFLKRISNGALRFARSR